MSAFDIIKLPPDFDITNRQHIDSLPRQVVVDLVRLIDHTPEHDMYSADNIDDSTILANLIYNIILYKSRQHINRATRESMALLLKDAYTKKLKDLLYEYNT